MRLEPKINHRFPRAKAASILIKSLFRSLRTLWRCRKSWLTEARPTLWTRLQCTTNLTLLAAMVYFRQARQLWSSLVSRWIRPTLSRWELLITHRRLNGCTFYHLRPHSSKFATKRRVWSQPASVRTFTFSSRRQTKMRMSLLPRTGTTTTRLGSTVRGIKFWFQSMPTPSSMLTTWTRSLKWLT